MKRISLLIPLVVFAFKLSVPAQDTAFTYQGQLTESGNPVNGNYDFQFRLFGVPSGGTFLFVFATNNVPLSNGLFSATVDFGALAFSGGADRWLEIGVRTNGAVSFATLAARQRMTSTPYAIRALIAGTVPSGAITSSLLANGAVTTAKLAPGAVTHLGGSDGSPTNAVMVNASGLVGVGTNDPQAGLDIAATASILSARRLFQVEDEMSGYTNLDGAVSLAVSGNLLAIGSQYDHGVTVIDLAGSSPVRRSQFGDGEGSFTNLNGLWGLAMKTNLLAIAAFIDDAVTLVSLTNPSSPVRLAELRDGIGGWNELQGARAVAISGNVMAIAGTADNAVTLADVSNPLAPIKRVEMKDGVFGFTNLAQPISVAISGNLLAIGANADSAVTLVDITDPANPVKRAELRNGFGGYDDLTRIYSVALSSGLLAVASVDDHAVTLVSVTNPASPVKLAVIKNGVGGVDWLSGPITVAISGNRLAVGAYYSGTAGLLDISDPSRPRQLAVARDNVGGFNFMSGLFSVAFAGTNLAIAATEDDGFTLASFPQASAGLLSQGWVGIGTDLPAAALNVVGDVIVQGQLFDINAERIELGIAVAATGIASTAMGQSTRATGPGSTAMGNGTTASGSSSTAMGSGTTASGPSSTAMGFSTTASGAYSTSMGYATIASGDYSVAMGLLSEATEDWAIAMGRNAEALHQGAFVWGDSTSSGFVASANNNSVTMRASGGYRLFSNSGLTSGAILAANSSSWAVPSDRESKKNFQPLKGKEILEKVASLPIQRWNYQWESDRDVPHIGPVAQDFKAAFYPGRDEKTITTLEFDGVALAAIQGLNQKVEEQRAELNRLKNQNQVLQERLQRIEVLLHTSR